MSSPAVWSTERRNPRTTDLDTLDEATLVRRILTEDAAVMIAVQACADQIAATVELAVSALSRGGTMHYVGAGTPGRLAVLDAAELRPTFNADPSMVVAHIAGGPEAVLHAAEGAEDDDRAGADAVAGVGPDDVVVGIAASGRTPYVRGALQKAREAGCPTVLISSNTQAPIAVFADVAILTDTGPEVLTGSTRMKAATAQKIVLNTLSTATMVRLGKSYQNLMIDVVATNSKLERRMIRILEQASGKDEDLCREALRDAGGVVRVAVVALLAGVDGASAAEAVRRTPTDAARRHDPSGVRTAVDLLHEEQHG